LGLTARRETTAVIEKSVVLYNCCNGHKTADVIAKHSHNMFTMLKARCEFQQTQRIRNAETQKKTVENPT